MKRQDEKKANDLRGSNAIGWHVPETNSQYQAPLKKMHRAEGCYNSDIMKGTIG